jgi:hypothetical protein
VIVLLSILSSLSFALVRLHYNGASFISPYVQRDAINAWATPRGHKIIEWHEELDRSGGTRTHRPLLDERRP